MSSATDHVGVVREKGVDWRKRFGDDLDLDRVRVEGIFYKFVVESGERERR